MDGRQYACNFALAAPFMFILDSFETACMELSILELFTTHQQGYNHTHIQRFI